MESRSRSRSKSPSRRSTHQEMYDPRDRRDQRDSARDPQDPETLSELESEIEAYRRSMHRSQGHPRSQAERKRDVDSSPPPSSATSELDEIFSGRDKKPHSKSDHTRVGKQSGKGEKGKFHMFLIL